MSPLRVWIDHEQAPACKPGAHVKLSADESAHVVRSLRARRGDAVVLLDGEGLVVEGKLAFAVERGKLKMTHIDDVVVVAAEPEAEADPDTLAAE